MMMRTKALIGFCVLLGAAILAPVMLEHVFDGSGLEVYGKLFAFLIGINAIAGMYLVGNWYEKWRNEKWLVSNAHDGRYRDLI